MVSCFDTRDVTSSCLARCRICLFALLNMPVCFVKHACLQDKTWPFEMKNVSNPYMTLYIKDIAMGWILW